MVMIEKPDVYVKDLYDISFCFAIIGCLFCRFVKPHYSIILLV